jgi:hypothetical protein
VDREQRQQGALPPGPDGELAVAVARDERTEHVDPERHRPTLQRRVFPHKQAFLLRAYRG